MKSTERKHIPVLLDEVIQYLDPQPNQNIIDCNLGYGGHAKELLIKTSPSGILIGIDLDNNAIQSVEQEFSKIGSFCKRFFLINDNFKNIAEVYHRFLKVPIHHVLFDLGVSSAQLEDLKRGFGYNTSGFLNMNFEGNDVSDERTAWKIINYASECELIKIFKEYGEDRYAKPIARLIISKRKEHKIDTANQLADIVLEVYKKIAHFNFKLLARGKHPATKIFQALRIAVNQELQNLTEALPHVLDILQPGGKLAVISFHSLEDRIVKQFFKQESSNCICPKDIPICRCNHTAKIKILTKKPIIPKPKEISFNPRARSSKLRVAEKL